MSVDPSEITNRRVLVIDDRQSIQEDFRKILAGGGAAEAAGVDQDAEFLFGNTQRTGAAECLEVDAASQGEEGLQAVKQATEEGRPYAVAFVDVRMPPGWDGVETTERLWQVAPDLQVVLCSAYSDYTWEQTVERLGRTDQLLILRKPFDNVEVRQLATALVRKWELTRQARLKLDEMARMVMERSRELTRANMQLTTAKLAAEAASRAKSEFLANMSHELRTPLTAILGFTETLLGDERVIQASPRAAQAIDTIMRNGEFLLDVINDILDLAKIEAGMISLHRTQCSPVQLVEEVRSLMEVRASQKQLSLHVEYVDPIPETIQTDATRLRQILINLVGNAIKFTESGQVRLTTRLIDDPGDTGVLEFEVCDTGIGMSEEQITRVFHRFVQADASTTRRFGGTGLGLSISKLLATMLGGSLTAESELGVGSTFRARVDAGSLDGVPMVDTAHIGLDMQSVKHAARIDPTDDIQLNCRLLLAEDSPDIQRLVSFVLEQCGAEVTIAGNGEQAVEQALAAQQAGQPYDLVLMDMQMPVLDGYGATRRLRREGYLGPIIALTAHALVDDAQKCLDAGCTDYSTKPIHRRKLLQMIAEHIAARPTAGEEVVT